MAAWSDVAPNCLQYMFDGRTLEICQAMYFHCVSLDLGQHLFFTVSL